MRKEWRNRLAQILWPILVVIAAILALNFFAPGWWPKLLGLAFPCQTPITYSLGTFDKRFNISQKDFLAAVAQAEGIWEKAIGRRLFTYVPQGGALTINLVYDERQAATDQLRQLGIESQDDLASYKKLKADYDAWQAQYKGQKAALDAEQASFNTSKAAYDREVAYWNSRGGAPQAEFDKLEQERVALNAEADKINADVAALNKLVDQINAAVTVLNRLAKTLNQASVAYNAAGSSIAKGFEEGDYESGPGINQINIYQFQDRDKLVRVLAHELGHALGLPHLGNPAAIMYSQNEGMNEKATPDDVAALKAVCRIP
jgi:hypothetical protein